MVGIVVCVQKLIRWRREDVDSCENKCRPPGSESLPEGIVAKDSNLERRPLWGSPKKLERGANLFAVAAGIKQKEKVDKMVEKRFLHPDIVAAYEYVFIWDEDLGVENFDPENYISIVKNEGLEISQPALDPSKSEVHHQITARGRRSKVHRRTYKLGDKGIVCNRSSMAPPCTGFIEVMAPVFSKAAWRCVWYLIQNDLIHAWGLDMQLGHCAQGDRTVKIGVVDAEYIVHYGFPTLGEPSGKKVKESSGDEAATTTTTSNSIDFRVEVRRQSFNEYKVFKRRWKKAAEMDKCWVDKYPNDTSIVMK
nr:uncharacterized protein LOC109187957 isoform X1 [Ipomoea batatas]